MKTSSVLRALVSFVQALLSALADVLAPRGCTACDADVGRRAIFCGACAATLEPVAAAEAGCAAPFVFGGALREAIHKLKYGKRPDLGAPLGELLRVGCLDLDLGSVDVVVPVPLHPVRLAERGYNQSALVARALARDLKVPMNTSCLARTSNTKAQAKLAKSERAANVKGRFVAREVSGKSVLVVDDVVTTGATSEACTRALLDAGARRVRCVAIARAL